MTEDQLEIIRILHSLSGRLLLINRWRHLVGSRVAMLRKAANEERDENGNPQRSLVAQADGLETALTMFDQEVSL